MSNYEKMSEVEKANWTATFEKDRAERKSKKMICQNCMFYKPLKSEPAGRCLSKVNGVKNHTTIWKASGGPHIVNSNEIQTCYK